MSDNEVPITAATQALTTGEVGLPAKAHRPEFSMADLGSGWVKSEDSLRAAFSNLLSVVETVARAVALDRALVMTKLQEACMWAVRGLAESKSRG